MGIEIRKIDHKKIWEDFVLSDKKASFLQSWNWGAFQELMGEKIFRLGLFEKDKLVGVALIIKVHAKRGNHFICPAGPLINWENQSHFQILIEYLKKLAKKEKISFIRIRPPIEDHKENRDLFQNLGFRSSPMHLHAERSWLLDITVGEETLLANMRKTTRYLIRRAQREGVVILKSKKTEDVDYLYRLQKETVVRHHFVPFSRNHFLNLFKVFSADDQAELFLAKYKGEVIAAAIIMFYGQEAVYHYAASSSKYAKIPNSYLLVWKAILEAKKRGFQTFNFWGIAPPDKPYHRFAKLTLFKKGFGGREKVFLHAQDLPLNGWYLVNWLIETIRKKIRRL